MTFLDSDNLLITEKNGGLIKMNINSALQLTLVMKYQLSSLQEARWLA